MELAEAVGAYLAVALDRLADRSSGICTWTVDYDQIRNTFARFALPMTWDLAECVPLAEVSGGYPGQLELSRKCRLSHRNHREPKCTDNYTRVCLRPQRPWLIWTRSFDPPYYNAIPYSDLMDFFYIWLRRTLTGISGEMNKAFAEPLSPKWNHEQADGELIDDDSRFDGDREASKRNYTDGMAKALQGCEQLTEAGRLVIVFANKSVVAWETWLAP